VFAEIGKQGADSLTLSWQPNLVVKYILHVQHRDQHRQYRRQRRGQRIASLGKPLLVGLTAMAMGAGISGYVLIDLIWRWRVLARAGAAPDKDCQSPGRNDVKGKSK